MKIILELSPNTLRICSTVNLLLALPAKYLPGVVLPIELFSIVSGRQVSVHFVLGHVAMTNVLNNVEILAMNTGKMDF